MKRGHKAAALTAGLLVSAIVAGSPAGAGEPAPTGTITVDPPIGRPGIVFMFSGEGCVSEAGPGEMELSVFFGGELITAPDPAFVEPDDEGSWGFGINPNGFMSNEAAVGTWEVTGTCFDAETGEVLVDYETATFEVIGPPAPPATNPRAAPPSTSTPTEPEPAAKPATPVVAEPNLTG